MSYEREFKDRNLELVESYRTDPDQTQEILADRFGITRQRVAQILSRYKVKKPKKVRGTCKKCNGRLAIGGKSGLCKECWKESFEYTVTCLVCQERKTFKGQEATSRRYYDSKRTRSGHFCSKACAGVYAGNNYGFGKTE